MFKDSRHRLKGWWNDLAGRQQIGYLFAAAGVVLTLTLALLRGFAALSSGWSLLLAVLGVLFQGGAAFAFGGVGKADPTHAQASAGHLLMMEQRTHSSLRFTETAYEADPPLGQAALKEKLGMLSRDLSFIEEDAKKALVHWELFHEKAVNTARSKTSDEGEGKI